MPRKRATDHPPCPRCGSKDVIRNSSKGGRPRWVCKTCRRSFGPTTGTSMYRLRTPPEEIARALLVVMRRGRFQAAEEITGYKVDRTFKRRIICPSCNANFG